MESLRNNHQNQSSDHFLALQHLFNLENSISQSNKSIYWLSHYKFVAKNFF